MTAPGPPLYSPLPPPGSTVVGSDGVVVGRVAAVVASPTGPPTWVAVTLAGTDSIVLAPLAGSERTAMGIVLGVVAAALRDAPRTASRTASFTTADGVAASSYYRRRTPDQPPAGRSDPLPSTAPHEETHSGNASATAEATVIRSREDLRVRTERYPYRRVRLRKRVVTEERTITVTVRREEFVLDDTDLNDTDFTDVDLTDIDLAPGSDLDPGLSDEVLAGGDGVIEMTLYAERPVVTTEVVAVERIRVRVVVVDGEPVRVTENVRREEVDISRE